MPRFGLIPKILYFFIDSPLTPLAVAASILLGALAVFLLSREEEPQIVVPVVDVFIEMPGVTAEEVERRVTLPLEKLAWELPGVEYVYSTSSPGRCFTVVRNSIIQVDFIKLRVKQGMPLAEAAVDTGAVHFRNIILTPMGWSSGGRVIVFDPIVQGLAISLMAGEVASLLLSRRAVPIIDSLAMRHHDRLVID